MEDGVQWIRLPYLVGEKCLDKSTGKVVTVPSCEPVNIKNISLADIKLLGLPDDATPFDVTARLEEFMQDWIKRHPGKEWCWRTISKEIADK